MITFATVAFLVVLFFGFPIPFAVGTVGVICVILTQGIPLFVVVQRMFSGIDSFTLTAIPFFVLAGEAMNRGGLTKRLTDFAMELVGRIAGGLAHVNVVESAFFAGISGSAVADVAALGKFELRMMKEAGYPIEFAAAVTAASALLGPIIPPSLIAIVYGATLNVSIGGLFAAGVIPGIIITVVLCIYCYIVAKRKGYSRFSNPFSFKGFMMVTMRAAPVLVLPLIILGGILGGIFTATEAGAVAAAYAIIVSYLLFGLRLSDMGPLFVSTAKVTGFILWIIACANVLAWVVNVSQLPQQVQSMFLSITKSPIAILFMINLAMLIVGMFLESTAAIIIFCPVFIPTLHALGFSPIHVGLLMVLNLTIGMITPPFGTVLFLTSALAEISIETLVRSVYPFILLEIGVLFLIALVPDIATFFPKLLGYVL